MIITPEYNITITQTQYPITKITKKLHTHSINIHFNIHPITKHLPKHINILLTKTKIPYNIILKINKINNNFTNTNTILIINTNNTINPTTQNNPKNPITNIPILKI